ncbi:MAG: M28 family metallopeptidase [Candidatus Hodarchaeota archaeon]
MDDISNSFLYNKKSAINHVKSLAFGRKVGTEGEIRTINYIRNNLKEEGIKFEIEPFLLFSIWRTLKLYSIGITFLIFADSLSSFFMIGFLLFKLMILILLFFLIKQFIDSTNLSWLTFKLDKGQIFSKHPISQNLLTTVIAKQDRRKRPVVILCAHYDSLSVNYSGRSLISTNVSFFFYFIVYYPINYYSNIYFAIKLLNCLVILVYLIFLLTIKIDNQSKGSIDNASGTAILIELSKIFYNKPLNNLDLIFLWTGAEELGLWGSKNYCTNNFKQLDKKYNLNNSYIINIDMVGSYIGLVDNDKFFKKSIHKESLNNLITNIAREKEISLRKEKSIIKLSNDYMVFRTFAKKLGKKLQICSFNSRTDKKFIHSPKDTPEKCISKNLNDCIEICYFTLKKIDADLVRTPDE